MTLLYTTLGARRRDQLGMILPHEHVFVDLRTPETPGHGVAAADDVLRLMGLPIAAAAVAGVSAIVDCGPIGVGRRADILKHVSEATSMPIVVPTGIYREPWVPAWALAASETTLEDWMRGELDDQIEHSGVRAGFIKLSAGDDGMTDAERRILRAATRAATTSGAAIGSHTIRAQVVHDQLDTLEATGGDPSRFVWIHASADTLATNLEIAARGAWIEYDWIGEPADDPMFIERVLRMCDAGYADRLLLSHDRGWYDPAQPGGGRPKPYTYIIEVFLPRLRAAGANDALIHQLTVVNPFAAFSR